MKTSEHLRMEEFYDSNFPEEIWEILNWEMDESGEYIIGFARLAWMAWQEAQNIDLPDESDLPSLLRRQV